MCLYTECYCSECFYAECHCSECLKTSLYAEYRCSEFSLAGCRYILAFLFVCRVSLCQVELDKVSWRQDCDKKGPFYLSLECTFQHTLKDTWETDTLVQILLTYFHKKHTFLLSAFSGQSY
jgi:hypothetical protein